MKICELTRVCVCPTAVVVRQLFYYTEEYGLLNPLNENDRYALHCIYIPRINRALMEFQRHYNYHPLRTEHNLTPTQIFQVSPRSPAAESALLIIWRCIRSSVTSIRISVPMLLVSTLLSLKSALLCMHSYLRS